MDSVYMYTKFENDSSKTVACRERTDRQTDKQMKSLTERELGEFNINNIKTKRKQYINVKKKK